MKKITLYIILSVVSIGFVNSQNLRWSYEVTNPAPNQSRLTVYVENAGPMGNVENFSAFNFGFYFRSNEATAWGQVPGFLSNNMTPAQILACIDWEIATNLGWAPDGTGAIVEITNPPAGVDPTYDRVFHGQLVDGNFAGLDVVAGEPPIAIIAFIMDNSVGELPPSQETAHMVGSDNIPAYAYSDINFNEFPIVVTGLREQALPITLLSFNAEKYRDRHALLSWVTTNETNSDYFAIQRSFDNRNWMTVGHVKAAGNSTDIRTYEFIDENVYNGRDKRLTAAYRLMMVDLDDQSNLSPIRSVVFIGDGNSGRDLFVYPNPATEGVQVEWSFDNDTQPVRIDLLDASGRLVLTQKLLENSGQEYIRFDGNINTGHYILRLMGEKEILGTTQVIVGNK